MHLAPFVIAIAFVASQAADPIAEQLAGKTAAQRLKAAKDIAALGAKGARYDYALTTALAKDPKNREAYLEAIETIRPDIHKHIVTLAVARNGRELADAMKELADLGTKARCANPLIAPLFSRAKKAGFRDTGLNYACEASFQTMAKIAPDDPATHRAFSDALAEPKSEEIAVPGIRKRATHYVLATSIPAADAIKALSVAVKDEESALEAIRALGLLGKEGKDALPLLKKLSLNEDGEIRDAAGEAIKRIKAGKDRAKPEDD